MTFDDDFALSEAAQSLQNKVYNYIFGDYLKKITRFSKEDRHILDVEYHIDVELELINGIKFLGQEKALRKRWADLNTFTIEFYQNESTKEKGEFFNLGAQFYLHGYINANLAEDITKFIKCYFIKIFDFLEWLKKKPIEELEKNTRPTKGSRASFYWINYNEIPRQFLYWYYKEGKVYYKQQYIEEINNEKKST